MYCPWLSNQNRACTVGWDTTYTYVAHRMGRLAVVGLRQPGLPLPACAAGTSSRRQAGLDIFPMGWGSKLLICPICIAGVVGGRLWLTGFPLCFCEKYGKLARTDLKNERISRSGGFQACYEIIRGVVGGLNSS
jgi:hypothetical protein